MRIFFAFLFLFAIASCGGVKDDTNDDDVVSSKQNDNDVADDDSGVATDEDRGVSCIENSDAILPCGFNGNGKEPHKCTDGEWISTGECSDEDECLDAEVLIVPCGKNDNGKQEQICDDGFWRDSGECEDPDVCFSGEEQAVACGEFHEGSGTEICDNGVWRLKGECVQEVCNFDRNPIQSLAIRFSPDGAILAYLNGTTVQLYRTESWEKLHEFEIVALSEDMQLSDDAQQIAVNTEKGLFIYSREGEIIRQLSALPSLAIAFYPSSQHKIASIRCQNDNLDVITYDTNNGEVLFYFGNASRIQSNAKLLTVSPKGTFLTFYSGDFLIFDATSPRDYYFLAYGDYPDAVLFSPVEDQVLTVGMSDYIIDNLTNLSVDMQLKHEYAYEKHAVATVFTQYQREVLVLWSTGELDTINIAKESYTTTIPLLNNSFSVFDMSSNAQLIAAGSGGGFSVFTIEGEKVK